MRERALDVPLNAVMLLDRITGLLWWRSPGFFFFLFSSPYLCEGKCTHSKQLGQRSETHLTRKRWALGREWKHSQDAQNSSDSETGGLAQILFVRPVFIFSPTAAYCFENIFTDINEKAGYCTWYLYIFLRFFLKKTFLDRIFFPAWDSSSLSFIVTF